MEKELFAAIIALLIATSLSGLLWFSLSWWVKRQMYRAHNKFVVVRLPWRNNESSELVSIYTNYNPNSKDHKRQISVYKHKVFDTEKEAWQYIERKNFYFVDVIALRN